MNIKTNDGYILIASKRYFYFQMAINCAESLLDYNPDAKITLFTHEEWVDSRCDIFDKVVTGVPVNIRAKLWALSQSPYDRTFYIDAECEIVHEDIASVFDTLEDSDMKVMRVRPYAAAVTKFPGGELTQHCGAFVYRKSEELYQFFDEWYKYYLKQQDEWDLDPDTYPPGKLKPWDMFTFWRLLNLEGWNDRIKVDFWEDDARWNFHGLNEEELKAPMVVHHRTTTSIRPELYKNEKNISTE